MPGGDALGAERVRQGYKIFKFHGGIAEDAGVRRLAPEVGLREGAADLLLQLLFHIQHGQRDADIVRGADGVGPLLFPGVIEIQTVHLVPLTLQELRAHGGIHPAGKAQDDFHGFLSP